MGEVAEGLLERRALLSHGQFVVVQVVRLRMLGTETLEANEAGDLAVHVRPTGQARASEEHVLHHVDPIARHFGQAGRDDAVHADTDAAESALGLVVR